MCAHMLREVGGLGLASLSCIVHNVCAEGKFVLDKVHTNLYHCGHLDYSILIKGGLLISGVASSTLYGLLCIVGMWTGLCSVQIKTKGDCW